jgi:hypothetical protein
VIAATTLPLAKNTAATTPAIAAANAPIASFIAP